MRRDGPPGLLLIDAEPAQAGLMSALAQRAGWRVLRAADVGDALRRAARAGVRLDAALIDLWSPDPAAAERSIAQLRKNLPDLPIIVVTAQDSVALAVRAVRAGARDVVVKPIARHRLLAALDHAIADDAPAGELQPLVEKWSEALDFSEIVGSAPGFRRALGIAMRAAQTPATILIEGESGVGKEVLAQAIHRASACHAGPLITVNCAAIPANLVESELFGHERGAFTGAFERRPGLFANAHGGTIFLDEIGDLPADAQAKLLRVLQSGEIRPLGAAHPRQVSVRVVAATNRRLSDDVARGRFREDLFYRLAVVPVTLPPLRDRGSDIAPLAVHLLERIARQLGLASLAIDASAIELLEAYDWPGNVRQLHNVLFRAAIFCGGDTLSAADFPRLREGPADPQPAANDDAPVAAMAVRPAGSVALFGADGHVRPIEEIEADLIRMAIGHYRGRMTEVARRLRIGRSTLYRKLGELGIEQTG
ncbi:MULTISPECIES: sigma-54-dependent transcriptional regulator [unclassified Sphingomonas]|uniref:sigma-54-dependent transcriptional regulator n=1 Tax=unclassified Sphingomonas TaxID=196159 RepID=UPI0006F65D96|nr:MULTISPECIES: sigma-54 dependent transcriptional regulator [unclassified Sphingomonas]KQX25901.1 Fis family transcriptional regulator [Sphingomonas sp. Root1294]KQY68966.1 Fis family transcriptional regulator [Sphingomonas sp. Root50]KRB89222.1 Fis family transcriptional regulator [Sphingomonas sp. Root720]